MALSLSKHCFGRPAALLTNAAGVCMPLLGQKVHIVTLMHPEALLVSCRACPSSSHASRGSRPPCNTYRS